MNPDDAMQVEYIPVEITSRSVSPLKVPSGQPPHQVPVNSSSIILFAG